MSAANGDPPAGGSAQRMRLVLAGAVVSAPLS